LEFNQLRHSVRLKVTNRPMESPLLERSAGRFVRLQTTAVAQQFGSGRMTGKIRQRN